MSQNVGATPLLVACGSVSMSGIKLFQNAGSVQEIVHQRIDRDHLTARLPQLTAQPPDSEGTNPHDHAIIDRMQ
jgi:hypothetical protein